MPKIKVLFVIDRIMVGGAEQVFVDILKLMQGKVEPSILLVSYSEPEQLKRVYGLGKVYELNRGSKFGILSLIKTYRIIQSVDILHVHLRPTLRYVNFVRIFVSKEKPLIFHDHHHVSDVKMIHQILMFKLFKLDYYLAVNQNVLKWAKKNWKFKSTGFLLNLPPNDCYEKLKMSNYIFHNNNINTGFVCVGNIKRSKNQIFASQLAYELRESITFYGNNQDLEYFNRLNAQESVIIVEGNSNPSEYFDNFKFGLCTSISESGPLVILEYFVAGLPFLSYKTGGIADVLYKYVPEYFLESFEMKDWIDRYNELNRSYKRIPQDLIDLVIDREFNRDVYANKLMEIYSECLKSAS